MEVETGRETMHNKENASMQGVTHVILYFSGTGNSRFAAQFLARQLGDEAADAGAYIKAGERAEFHSERPWVFVAPTYSWQMPHLFARWIRDGAFSGSDEAYFLLTCGGEIGNAGQYTQQLCEEKGLRHCGTRAVVMPENFIAMFNAPGPEEAKAIVEAAKPVLQGYGEQIARGAPLGQEKCGVLDRLKSGAVNRGFYRFFVKADPYYVTDACVGCGKCVSGCVLNNITLTDGRPVWGSNCTQCMACICGCPMGAIEYGKKSPGKPRYQCPDA